MACTSTSQTLCEDSEDSASELSGVSDSLHSTTDDQQEDSSEILEKKEYDKKISIYDLVQAVVYNTQTQS